MDPKALFSLSYGVFILGSHDDSKINACVTNTCMQVAAPMNLSFYHMEK